MCLWVPRGRSLHPPSILYLHCDILMVRVHDLKFKKWNKIHVSVFSREPTSALKHMTASWRERWRGQSGEEEEEELRVWRPFPSRCSWMTCWGYQSHCLLGETHTHTYEYGGLMSDVVLLLHTLYLGLFVWTPEQLRDGQDLDCSMSVTRSAAAIQLSLELLRLRTNLHGNTGKHSLF